MGKLKSEIEQVSIKDKLLLTSREASVLSGIGIVRIDEMLKDVNCPFVCYVGTQKRVIRSEFEKFITTVRVV